MMRVFIILQKFVQLRGALRLVNLDLAIFANEFDAGVCL